MPVKPHELAEPMAVNGDLLEAWAEYYEQMTVRLFHRIRMLYSSYQEGHSGSDYRDLLEDAELWLLTSYKPKQVAQLAQKWAVDVCLPDVAAPIDRALQRFDSATARLRDARNTVEHFDQFIRGIGGNALQWGLMIPHGSLQLVVGWCPHKPRDHECSALTRLDIVGTQAEIVSLAQATKTALQSVGHVHRGVYLSNDL